MKPAILILWSKTNSREMERILLFDDHNDAVDTAVRFEQLGYAWTMAGFKHYKQGEKPADTPALQKTLF